VGLLRRTSKVAATAGVAVLIALPFTPVVAVWAASSGISSSISPVAAADPTKTCKPDKDNDYDNNQESDNNANDDKNDKDDKSNKECPPPVVPEAPLAVLLPLSAGIMISGTYVVMRLRGRSKASA
jgi:stringent starvation protein B